MVPSTETARYAADQTVRLLDRLAFQLCAARHSYNPETVHDLRVAIRRFSQALVVFKRCFRRKDLKKIRKSLKALMSAAGAVRDCDIALKFISEIQPRAADELEKGVRGRRDGAEGALQAEASRRQVYKWSLKWRSMLEPDHGNPGALDQGIQQMAASELSRVAGKFIRSGNRAASAKASEDQVHRFRIAAKKLRYTLELFRPFYGAGGDQELVRLARIQSLLGGANDCRVVRAMVSQIGGHHGFEAILEKKQRRKLARFRRYWAEEFHQTTAAHQWLAILPVPSVHEGRRSRCRPPDRADAELAPGA
jgi:CHAD domain-containing protein